MPEGPEVRQQAEFLVRAFAGSKIQEVELLSGRYTKKPFDGFAEMTATLPISVIGGGCHGKFTYLILSDGSSLHLTLGMTGGWLTERTKHARVRFATTNGDLFYTDQRNFGTIKWCRGREELATKLRKFGPDVMQPGGEKQFLQRIRRKDHWNVCKALMDQSVVAGIGNYLKAEILYQTRIDPWSQVADLKDEQLQAIFKAAGELAWQSYRSGGATIQSYRNPDGSEGAASRRFAVYGQPFDPQGNEVITEKTPDGRTTHWVPTIQSA